MKTPHTLVIALIVLAILSALTSCTNTPEPKDTMGDLVLANGDTVKGTVISIPFAVVRSTPVNTHKTEVIYIDMDDFRAGAYQNGDTIEVNGNHFIPAGNTLGDTSALHWVVIKDMTKYPKIKRFTPDQAEHLQ